MINDAHRLPEHARPQHYRLELDPDLAGGTFRGTVAIDLTLERASDEVVLNAEDLVIEAVRSDAGAHHDHRLDPERQRVHVAGPFDAGPLRLELDFSGRFNEQLVGFYLSRFTDADGAERAIATTQFEATHARKCFPCFDEPAMKATFEVSLIVEPGHLAVSNSAEVSRSPTDDGRHRVTFAPTMVMSTYLVAFVVGPMEATAPVDVDGVPLRVIHVPGKGHLAAFALEAGAFALRYFADYFDVAYPGNKLDMVAIPDFAFGAMENLGCVTFRELLLLIDPEHAVLAELQRVTDVITHELAHMWFGDLVTMEWWNGLWLNEAFATFMEMKCTDAWKPEWRRWDDFSQGRTAAFDVDSLAATRPVEYEVVSPTDAEGMFDLLTYQKGAAVVRMLEQYLGEDRFRDGIRRYMATHAYANADTTDLWDAVEASVGEPVRRIMDSWIFQGGYPLVSVSLAGDRLTLHQQRFSFAGGDPVQDQRWAVPVRVRTLPAAGEDRVQRVLLDDDRAELDLGGSVPAVVVNAEAAGFFRVRYPEPVLEQLAANAGRLAPVERYALIDDAWAAVLAGQASSTGFLVLLESLAAEERDRAVWVRIVAGFAALCRLVDGEAGDRLATIVGDALARPLQELGRVPRPGEADLTRALRGELFRAAGLLAEDPHAIDDARAIATGDVGDAPADAAMVAAAVDIVAHHGDEADFDTFLAAWQAATTPQEEIRLLYSLADFREPSLTDRVHELVLSGKVRSQNVPFVLRRALLNRQTGRQTWEFITRRWVELNDSMATSSIVRMLEGLPSLDEPDDVESAAAFFAQNPVPQGAKTLAQLLERQRVQVALRQREADRLRALLAG